MVDVDIIGEKLGLKSLGINKAQADELHAVAKEERARQRAEKEKEAAELLQIRDELKKVGNQFLTAYEDFKDNEQQVIEVEDGKYLVVKKMKGRLRMEITDDPTASIGNDWDYFKDLDAERIKHVSARQEVVTLGGNGEVIDSIHIWNKEQLKAKIEHQPLEGDSETVVFLYSAEKYPDIARKSFAVLDKVIPIPQAMLRRSNNFPP